MYDDVTYVYVMYDDVTYVYVMYDDVTYVYFADDVNGNATGVCARVFALLIYVYTGVCVRVYAILF